MGRLGRSKASLEASWTFLEVLGGVLEGSWRPLGLSWERLGGVLGASWAVLERRRGILEASWSVLRTSWAVFERFYWHKTVFLSHAILDAIFQSILARCCARNLISESRKIIKFYWKNMHFLLLGCFNIRSLLDAILVSTWIHFCIKNPAKSRLGGVLGRLVGVLAASWAVLEAS